ncbi:MAG: hypothetical protein V6018_01440 [Candidatus Dasytiphilus stammeri]
MSNQHTINNDMNDFIVPLKHLSWNAVFAGVILSIIIELLFIILGTAVGAIKTINILFERNYINNIGTGTGITFWIIISMLVAISVGAYISGRLANSDGVLHGIIVWSVNTLIYFWFLFFIFSSAISNTMNLIGTGLKTISNSGSMISHVTQLTEESMPNNISDSLKGELEQLLQMYHDPSLVNWWHKIMASNQTTLRQSDITALREIIKLHTGESDQQVEELVQKVVKLYEKYQGIKSKTIEKVMDVAETTIKTIARISWFTFFFLILEGFLAAIMGLIGYRHRHRTS